VTFVGARLRNISRVVAEPTLTTPFDSFLPSGTEEIVFAQVDLALTFVVLTYSFALRLYDLDVGCRPGGSASRIGAFTDLRLASEG